jgi:hypothetical protein
VNPNRPSRHGDLDVSLEAGSPEYKDTASSSVRHDVNDLANDHPMQHHNEGDKPEPAMASRKVRRTIRFRFQP